MIRTLLTAGLACIVAAGPSFAADEASGPAPRASITQIAVCRQVEDRAPVGEADSFPNDVGRLCCFTHVETSAPPVTLYHRWYVGDRLVNEIPITAKGTSWRCWSRKTISTRWTGPCRVEIATEAGDVLATKSFSLEPAAGQMKQEAEAPEAHD